MSLLKSKSFLKGVLLTVFLTLTSTAMAFTPVDGRLWKPYQPETFGGQRRSGNGLYAEISGILWKVDGPNGIPVGYRNPDGSSGTRWAYTGGTTILQTNQMNTRSLDSDFTLGTRLEVGNVRGHHGWLFSGYGLSDNNSSQEFRGASMVIKDSNTAYAYSHYAVEGSPPSLVEDYGYVWAWDSATNQPYWDGTYSSSWQSMYGTGEFVEDHTTIPNVGYLYGWFPHVYDDIVLGYLAPIPITFDRAQFKNSTDIMSLELMYTYRPHPFKWGEMDLLAGARYWDFDDKFTFLGLGFEEAYTTLLETDDDSSGSSNDDDDDDNTVWHPSREQLAMANSNSESPLTILADTEIVGRVRNRIIGPQIGVKLTRRNARWTFGAEGRFMAGINNQSQTVSGALGTHFVDPTVLYQSPVNGDTESTSTTAQSAGIVPYMPVGLRLNQQSFYHHKNKTVFSPGFEIRLSAKWQWTDAIGVKIGFDSTIFDNIGRGADIVDYKISENGELFGIRSSCKTSVITYGFNFGLEMRR